MNTDIRIKVSFRNHRKRKRLRSLLGPGATDYLLDLWLATAMNHPDGVLAGMDHMDIALEAGWEDDPDRFVSALVDCGFLETTEEGVYCLHDWVDHQPYVRGAPVRAERARKGALAKWGIDPEEGQEHPQTKRHERLAEARKKGTHTKEQWDSMVGLFEGTCVRCGQTEADLVKDHITPIYQGGSDGIENIQPLCRKCNSSKGPESKDYRGIMASRMGKKVPEDWHVDACLMPASRLLAPAQTPAPSPSPSPSPDPEPGSRSKPDAAEIPNSVSACESEALSPDPIPLFPETPQDLAREERECLGLLKAVPGRKYDHARDLKQLRTLATEYPLVDLRGEVAAACDWLRDNPKKGRGNPSLFLRNWMARSATRSPTRAPRGQEQDMATWLQQFDDPPGGGVVNA